MTKMGFAAGSVLRAAADGIDSRGRREEDHA
jgi:hypothetical protein